MTDKENYWQIVKSIFTLSKCPYNLSDGHYNHVIGELNHLDNAQFKANFVTRLNRLNKIYNQDDSDRKHLLDTIYNVADKNNWRGAFPELTAYDYFNRELLDGPNLLYKAIELNKTITADRTYAQNFGNTNANLDGFFDEFGVFFEVKCLKDNVSELLSRIYVYVKENCEDPYFSILEECPQDMHFDQIQENRNKLVNELKNAISNEKKPKFIRSEVIDELHFRLNWGGGMVIAERSFNPFEFAENYHSIVFEHTSKFVKDRPFFLVYVIFPWLNGIISDFNNSNIKFYRAFSRRVFCQYKHGEKHFNTVEPKFKGEETIYQVSKSISGLVFLEDNSILSKHPNNTNVKAYWYLNPNANNHLNSVMFKEYMMALPKSDYDDFQHDNY